MEASAIALPQLGVIQAALRKTTEALARALVHPTSEPAPAWSQTEWVIARASASLHGIGPLLASSLHWRAPPGWIAFLREQRLQTEGRYGRIRALLKEIDAQALQARLPFTTLKGAALHEIGLYRAGERPMADLDLLTAPQDVPRLAAILEGMGFHQTAITWKHRVFESVDAPAPALFGEHAGNGIKIDLHSRIRELLPLQPVDVTDIVWPRRPVPGLNAYPSQGSFMTHLLLHASGAILFRTLRGVQLHDMALLASSMAESDWEAVLMHCAQKRGPWWAFPPLELLARYYSCVPHEVLTAASTACGRPLRCSSLRKNLSDVSFSDLQRSAFPGFHWAQSLREKLSYVAERSVLSAQILMQPTAGARIPKSTNAIGQRAQVRRTTAHPTVLLRPVRPATLNAVRGAMALGQ